MAPPPHESTCSICELALHEMRDIVINRKVARVAIVAGIGRPIPVFSFAALKVFNTSNVLHLKLMHVRASASSLCELRVT